MRNLIALLFLIFATPTMAAAEPSLDAFFQDYISSYNGYFKAGENADINAVTAHFYEPTMQVPPRGNPVISATHADLNRNFTPFLQMLQKKGVVRLEWERKQVVRLGPNNAIASNVARAIDAQGKVVDRRASVYSIYLSDSGWKIALIQSHAVENVPQLSPGSGAR